MEPVTLRTARLELSTPRAEDAEAILAACQDPDIQRFTTVPTPYRFEHATGFIALTEKWWAEDAEAAWAIRVGDELAGVIGLRAITRDAPSSEIGYWMAPDHRGRGLLTEAARTVVEWAFSPTGPGTARIEWRAVVGNAASARVARSLGFRYEGVLRGALVNGAGRRSDGWIAGLLATDDREPQHWAVLA